MSVDFRFHRDGNNVAVEHVQDVEPIIERNKQLRREEQNCDWGREIGEIPNVLLVKWLNEEHARGNTSLQMFTPEFDKIIHKKLYDPEYAYLRTDRPALVSGWLGFGS